MKSGQTVMPYDELEVDFLFKNRYRAFILVASLQSRYNKIVHIRVTVFGEEPAMFQQWKAKFKIASILQYILNAALVLLALSLCILLCKELFDFIRYAIWNEGFENQYVLFERILVFFLYFHDCEVFSGRLSFPFALLPLYRYYSFNSISDCRSR